MKIRHSSRVIWDVVDGQTTLCDLESGEIFELTETGALIWKACDGSSLEEIVQSLRETYSDAEPERIAADANGFIYTLERAGLVQIEAETAAPGQGD